MDLLITRWGIENFPVILMHAISLAPITLLEDFQYGHDQQKKAFVSMCVTLRAASRRFKVGKGIMKLVQKTAEDRGVTLPRETERLFKFERRSPSASTGSPDWEDAPVKGIGVQYLLEKWDDLDLDDF